VTPIEVQHRYAGGESTVRRAGPDLSITQRHERRTERPRLWQNNLENQWRSTFTPARWKFILPMPSQVKLEDQILC
jgi:hypothetical protein